MTALGLDLGGTYIKAAWLRGGWTHEVQRLHMPDFIDRSGKARELDPASLLDAVHGILESYPGAKSIWIAGQMSCFTFVDWRGRALLPLISWQDERVTNTEQLASDLGKSTLKALGNELRPGQPVSNLSLTDAIPGDIRTKGQYTSLMGFVAGSLVGRWAGITHVTDAAASGMWDLTLDRWNDTAVARAGLRPDQLPTGTWSYTPIGRTAGGALVHVPIGDQQASLHGAGLRPGALSINIATGGQVSVVGEKSHARDDVQLRPYLNGKYLHTITHLPAGRALTAVVRLLCQGDTSNQGWEWAREACNSRSTDRSLVPPLRWNLKLFSEEGGTLSGLTGDTTPEQCMAAAVTSVADEFASAGGRLGDHELVIFSGGLAQKFEPIRRAISNILKLPEQVHSGDDATLDGLALVAHEHSG